MSALHVMLPDAQSAFVEAQAAAHGYGSASDYVRALIGREQEREALRALMLAGAASEPGAPAPDGWFDDLRRPPDPPR